jgi:hypothetical protein
MPDALTLLSQLQSAVAERGAPDFLPTDNERVLFAEERGALHVEIYSDPLGDSFLEVLETLAQPEVASRLGYLSLRGPDEGANGTRNWDLSRLLESDVQFPWLRGLFIEPSGPEWHNRSIVAVDYDEAGMLGQLLDRAPALSYLVAPSAPDRTFFQRTAHPLQYLRVEAGYDPQTFIRSVSESDCFPTLRQLDYTDYCERYADDYPARCTPFEDYRALFEAPAIVPVRSFTLRNAVLSPEQLLELKALRPALLFTTVQSFGEYVRA